MVEQDRRFNSRTHVGCDRFIKHASHLPQGFNSRTHVGCDVKQADNIAYNIVVSIHAPMWGATRTIQRQYIL